MNQQRLRVFVSSPGDVAAARELVAQVVEKLAHEYARFFALEPYLWEYEPMLASGHFQDSIDPPSNFDVVIIILESRLGTPLPEKTAVREYRGIDGRTPVTGTEWEYEDALTAARKHGVPDLLVYRSQRNAEISTRDPQSRRIVLAQLEALDVFWSRHFANRGSFIGAYAEFKNLEEVVAKVEKDLRRCVVRRVETFNPLQRAAAHPLWLKAPFRGLEAYEFEHAPIFFGRDLAIGSALLRLISNSQAGRPFLLVLGASGSGKSSLIKAGVVPRLLVPQRVSGAAFLRRAIFRAGDANADEDLFDALARCLTDGRTEGGGLPELLGDSMPVAEFAQHLRQASAHAALPFSMVLDRLAEMAREEGRMLRYQQAKLILIVDQLEEIYTGERVQPDTRRRFIELLRGLVRSGRVWVIASMRADFWHRAGETPDLIELADGQGRLDLLPASPAELSQMIRGPAESANIAFERHPTTGIPLNDVIAEEAAAEPGVLPLMSYLLDQLYQSDVRQARGDTLTYTTYESLGGLKGAIATRADAVLAGQSPEDRLALREVLFALVQMSMTEGYVEHAVARRAPLSDFPEGTAKRRLIEVLLDPSARLLVADTAGASGATVRLAHEALINEWQSARDYVAANKEALKYRRMVEGRYVQWQAHTNKVAAASDTPTQRRSPVTRLRETFRRAHGLLVDVDLTDAARLLRDYRDELAPELVVFIERSIEYERRQRLRAIVAVSIVAAVMTMLTIFAAYEANAALNQRNLARVAATTAERTSRFMVSLFDFADPGTSRGTTITARQVLDQGATTISHGLQNEPGIRADLLTAMSEAYIGLGLYAQAGALLARARIDERSGAITDESRVRTSIASGSMAYLDGHYDQAVGFLRPAVELARRKLPRTNVVRSAALTGLADALVAQGTDAEAVQLCLEALATDRARRPLDAGVLANTLNSLGSAYFFSGNLAAAEPPLREALQLREQAFGLNHARTGASLNNLGVLLYQSGRYKEALAAYKKALPIFRQVYTNEHPEVATLINNIGRSELMAGNVDAADPWLRQALSITEKFEGNDHDDLVPTLNSLAMIDAYRGRLDAARSEIQRAETIARLRQHSDILDQVLLNEADLELTTGSKTRASTLLAESKALLQKNYPEDGTTLWRYAIWDSINAKFLAMNGDITEASRTLAAAQIIINKRFGSNGFYSMRAQRLASDLASK